MPTRPSPPTAILLACTAAHLPPRAVPPARICAEFHEFSAAQQPIFDVLPHLANDDIQRLDYFCPADFNKHGSVDDADAQEFMPRLRDGHCDPIPFTEYHPIIC